MFSVQKVVQAYKANMNFNDSKSDYKKLPVGYTPKELRHSKDSKKTFDTILERAMKQN